jgi:4-hydroxyphenylpyruvate dioxygenase
MMQELIMLNSIATVSVSGTLDEKLRAIAAAKFHGVEIFENDLLTHPGSPREVGMMLRDLGLACTVYQPFRDFEGMPAELRQRVFDRAERKFDVMQELGTDLVLVCSNVSPACLSDRKRIIDDFRELGERAARRNLRIGYEALAWGRHIWDHRDAWAVVKAVNHSAVGLILDSFHSLARAVPIDSLRWIDPEKIFLVQIADAPVMHMDPLSWSRHFRCMPGQGDLPLVEYVATLVDIGYDDILSLEIFNDRFRAGSTATVAVDGKRSLIFLQDQVRQQRQLHSSSALAAPARCRGVEFIEFGASEAEAVQLGELLRTLGFTPVGRHRSKAVTRWQQGDINLVINCETEGFAHVHDVVHGASVCAIGLRVDDVTATMRRAQQLQIDPFSQPVAPGEMQIPAVLGVGGSLNYFIDSKQSEQVWTTEFLPIGTGAAQAGVGLTRVDHLSLAMQYEAMLSWLLYYVSLFAVKKMPPIEIADPAGLVVSQAIQSVDGQFRITLNGSAAAQTLASRFLHAYLGAGVQHIAFACDDIFDTAERLQKLGMEVLPIPANYYDDLAARFGLDSGMLKRMASYHILYDRDADGEYFQLYSRAFAKRFFFEMVQRRGYDGYGAANASIRLAAQSRYKVERGTSERQ